MSKAINLCSYNEKRLAIIIANPTSETIYISTNSNDISCGNNNGLPINSGEYITLTWKNHGELVWQIWYTAQNGNIIPTWEWLSIPKIMGRVLTPNISLPDSENNSKNRNANTNIVIGVSCKIPSKIFSLNKIYINPKMEKDCKNGH